jgi:hypothetical protein
MVLGIRLHDDVLKHPGTFALKVLKAFRANQGYLLAGAIAYNALLSIVPLLILILVVLTRFVDQAELLATLGRYLEVVVPGRPMPSWMSWRCSCPTATSSGGSWSRRSYSSARWHSPLSKMQCR